MQQQFAHLPFWLFCSGYFFGLSLAGAAVIRAAALKLKVDISPKAVDFLLLLHLVPIFLGIRFVIGGIMSDCNLFTNSASLSMAAISGMILSGVISVFAAKKLALKID